MQYTMQEPVEVLRQKFNGQFPADHAVNSAAATLSDRLARLKAASSLFDGVSFSPEMEAVMSQNLAMTAG